MAKHFLYDIHISKGIIHKYEHIGMSRFYMF